MFVIIIVLIFFSIMDNDNGYRPPASLGEPPEEQKQEYH